MSTPQIAFTPAAKRELELMLACDFTLTGKVLRLLISGKKCEGFLYSAGLTEARPDDTTFRAPLKSPLTVAMDPFTAFYLRRGEVDFVRQGEEEGLVVTNHDQADYSGKFWLKDQSKVPPGRT